MGRHRTPNRYLNEDDRLTFFNNTDGIEIHGDPCDLWELEHTWSVQRDKHGTIKCVRTYVWEFRDGRMKNVARTMHEMVMRDVWHWPWETEIDHIDGNVCNNRRDNLRWVTPAVNTHNKRDLKGNPLRGVYRDEFQYSPSSRRYRRAKLWCAAIVINGKKRKSRHFTAREAEEQYLIWKRQYHLETQTPEMWYEQYAACQASGYWD